ncbi:MAG: preprotein translocase subunit SecE [Gammaproteobacteria bacterium]|nr:preprotein translocase subunit SecE [Gammaproteobacteria bacterium]
MNSNVESSPPALDTAKLVFALALLVSALAAFYFFAEWPKLTRVVGLLVAIGIAVGVASQTVKGRSIAAFIGDAQIEVRKVVWPTRQETIQTTVVVMIVVVVAAIFLWLLDVLLGGLIQWLMGQKG